MNSNQTQISPPSSMIPSAGSVPLNPSEQLMSLSPEEALARYVASRNRSSIKRTEGSFIAPLPLMKLRDPEVLMAIKALEYRIGITANQADCQALSRLQVIIQSQNSLPGEFHWTLLVSLRILWSHHMDVFAKTKAFRSRTMLTEIDNMIEIVQTRLSLSR